MKKKKILYYLILFFLFLFVLLFVYSGKYLIEYYFDNKENHKIQTEIRKYIQVFPKEEVQYKIDFSSLKKLNPDTVAYLKVNGTDIDYVVVQGENNDYYLKHNFDKNWNNSGWVFGDYRNKFNGEDKNIVIYGHNTNDGSMFGTLKNVLKEEWNEKEENKIISFVTEEGEYSYSVFSSYITPPEEYYLTTQFKNSNEFMKYIDTVSKRSYFDYNVSISEEGKILTLSTCTPNGKERVVLHALLVDEKIINE